MVIFWSDFYFLTNLFGVKLKEESVQKSARKKKCKIDTGKIMYNIKIRQQSIILRSIAILTLVIVVSTFIIVLINF